MHSKQNLQEQLEDITDALSRHSDPQIQGAKLHRLIQDVAPRLNVRETVGIITGPGALKTFVTTYLNEKLEQIGFSGGDIIYGIKEHDNYSNIDEYINPNIWKTFVSPSSKYSLAVEKDNNNLIISDSTTLKPDEMVVPRVTIDEHNKLRDAFITTVSEEDNGSLRLESSNTIEYGDWLQVLRKHGIYKRWSEYRRNGLLSIFSDRLENLELEAATVKNLTRQMGRSQFASAARKPLPGPSQEQAKQNTIMEPQVSRHSRETSTEFGRKLVRSALEYMSYEDIRSINLPVGAVLDALKKN